MKNLKDQGITLIALIITIVLLLILAGVTLATMNSTGLLSKTKMAKEAYEKSQANEMNALNEYEQTLDYYKIKVGDEIKYTPSEDSSFTVPTYAGVNDGSVATLSTESLTWKVWKKTSDSILITPTTPTKATLKLGWYKSDTTDDSKREHGASAYNNAVQALNAYCRKYYSDVANEVYANSININDIEDSMTETGKKARYKNDKNNKDFIYDTYGQIINPNVKTNYPGLYALEEPETNISLGLSAKHRVYRIVCVKFKNTPSYDKI